MNRKKKFTSLILANKELRYQNDEKEKRAAELLIANQELLFQNHKKEKRAIELIAAYGEIKKAQEAQREYLIGIEKMMYMVSHEIRQPIAQLMGLSGLLEKTKASKPITTILNYIRGSIKALDSYTRDLTKFLSTMVCKNRPLK